MGDTELNEQLKEILAAFNQEARLASPAMQGQMCQTVDRLGGRWLLDALKAGGASGVDGLEQAVGQVCSLLKTESGQRQLQEALARRSAEIKRTKRRLVGVVRALSPDHPAMVVKVEPLADAEAIYRMLLPERGRGTE